MKEPSLRISWEEAVRLLINDPDKVELVKACYYDQPLSAAANRYSFSNEWSEIKRNLNEVGGLAVDVGAGNGIVSYALASAGWNVIAIEPDPSELIGAEAIRNLAKETGLMIDVKAGFGESLPIEDKVATVAIARQAMHHARDLCAFTREISRVLVPGGIFISLRDHVISHPNQLQDFLDRHPLHCYYGGENAFTRKQYRQALLGAGLVIKKELGSFESVINYAPHTKDSLRDELSGKLGPLSTFANYIMKNPFIFEKTMSLLSKIDNRPGRLISFFCCKEP